MGVGREVKGISEYKNQEAPYKGHWSESTMDQGLTNSTVTWGFPTEPWAAPTWGLVSASYPGTGCAHSCPLSPVPCQHSHRTLIPGPLPLWCGCLSYLLPSLRSSPRAGTLLVTTESSAITTVHSRCSKWPWLNGKWVNGWLETYVVFVEVKTMWSSPLHIHTHTCPHEHMCTHSCLYKQETY